MSSRAASGPEGEGAGGVHHHCWLDGAQQLQEAS